MKKYLFCLLVPVLAFFIYAGSLTQKNADTGRQPITIATTGENNNMPAGGCGSLIFFHKGAIVKGATYDSTGKEISKQTSTITDVKDNGGEITGTVKMDMSSSFGSHTMNTQYKCDGSNLYVDLNSLMANLSALKGAKVQTSSLKFPIHLSVGQSLPEASVTVEMDRGNMKMKMVTSYIDRKVEGTDKVTTQGGTWNCYRVASTIKSTTDYGNAEMQKKMEALAKKMPDSKMIAWFAPDFGIVKMEMYSGNKLITRSQVISVKQ